ncbi:transmembrane-type terpene cyclase [Archangium violaceum]|uniref:transmembrane-type terpene cyclase n=1 Tax=Archangium violaceum TaxID=83451 RepID=UPI0036DC7549
MNSTAINLTDYTLPTVLLFGASGLLWLVIYAIVLRDAWKHRFVAIPAFALSANLAYEFLWGFVFRMDMGSALADGSKAYFLLSLCMGAFMVRHGHKQFRSAPLRRHLVPLLLLSTLVWGGVLYFFSPAIDDPAGVSSAALLHLQMSALFLLVPLRLFEQDGKHGLELISPFIGWAKLLATVCLTLACVTHMPERHWVHAVCMLMLAFDVAYLLLHQMLKTSAAPRMDIARRLTSGVKRPVAA